MEDNVCSYYLNSVKDLQEKETKWTFVNYVPPAVTETCKLNRKWSTCVQKGSTHRSEPPHARSLLVAINFPALTLSTYRQYLLINTKAYGNE